MCLVKVSNNSKEKKCCLSKLELSLLYVSKKGEEIRSVTSAVSNSRRAKVLSRLQLGTLSGCMCRAPWNPTCAMLGPLTELTSTAFCRRRRDVVDIGHFEVGKNSKRYSDSILNAATTFALIVLRLPVIQLRVPT